MKYPKAKIIMENGKEITMELYPDVAPNTVNSFVYCARNGYYDNQAIRRIVPDFVIQPSYNEFENDPRCAFEIEGEYAMNGFDNPISFDPYVVAMGTEGGVLASGSCFFIVVGDGHQERLNGKYPAFGRVIDGFDEIERLCHVELKDVVYPDEPNVTIKEPLVREIMKHVEILDEGYVFENVKKVEKSRKEI